MRQKLFYRTAAFTLTGLLLYIPFSFANTVIADLNIPSQIGNIKEIFENQSLSPEARKFIIQIQDAHCNYEAQKNLVQILEYLVKEKDLSLVLVEGGSGDVSLSFLRGYSDKKTREEVAEQYLRMGKISGEEYLDIVSDYDLQLYGIEDEELYNKNLESFLDLDALREEGLQDLETLKLTVNELKGYIFGPELQAFQQKQQDYASKTITLAEYCQFLVKEAGSRQVAIEEFGHITAFAETARLEKEIDFKEAETQRNTFIKELAKALPEDALKELIAKSQSFKTGALKAGEYYEYLTRAAQGKIDIAASYPLFSSYTRYIKVSQDIDAVTLLKEVAQIEKMIKERLFVDNNERELDRIATAIEVAEGFLKLDLTPEEYEEFKANREKYITASWVPFLQDNARKYGVRGIAEVSATIDENMEQFNDFYQVGIAREQAFIKNLVSKMEKSKQQVAVLITGGFHTPGVSRLLKEKGYSYAVVAPTITKKSDSSLYFSVLKGEGERLEESINEDE
jgi:hypothetical protein